MPANTRSCVFKNVFFASRFVFKTPEGVACEVMPPSETILAKEISPERKFEEIGRMYLGALANFIKAHPDILTLRDWLKRGPPKDPTATVKDIKVQFKSDPVSGKEFAQFQLDTKINRDMGRDFLKVEFTVTVD